MPFFIDFKHRIKQVLLSLSLFSGALPTHLLGSDPLLDTLKNLPKGREKSKISILVKNKQIQTLEDLGRYFYFSDNGNDPENIFPPNGREEESFLVKFQVAGEQIRRLDKEKIESIVLNEKSLTESDFLFQDISVNPGQSYSQTLSLCNGFNPISKTNDHQKLNQKIDAYLKLAQKSPVIQFALEYTQTTLEDLKKSWFGPGLGFEHVFAGELKGSKVSGFHWWYRFYADEREQKAIYKSTLEGLGDPHIFTGKFSWDPDGGGPLKVGNKPKGGFIVGEGPFALLALGHIARILGPRYGTGDSFVFRSNINGKTYGWQVFLFQNSLRSLYPMVSGKTTNPSGEMNDHFLSDKEELKDYLEDYALLRIRSNQR